MALPTAPTILSVCTEAYTRSGIPTPSVEKLTRAENEWFEPVKRDIAARKKWHSIEETMIVIPEPYLQVYAMPTQLLRVLRMRFYRGTKTGIAEGGGTNTITIRTDTGDANDRGRKIFLTSGTGQAQAGRITAVSGNLYTISCPWDVTPIAGTGYMIADTEQPVTGPESAFHLDGIAPSTALLYWDFIEQNLRFWPCLDDANQYALELDGTVDISLIDKNDARIVRVLREWWEPLVRGLMVYIKEDLDDDQVDRDERKYEKATKNTMIQDARKRLRGEAPGFRSIGGAVKRRRY